MKRKKKPERKKNLEKKKKFEKEKELEKEKKFERKKKLSCILLAAMLLCGITAGLSTSAAGEPAMTVRLNGAAVTDLSEAIPVDNRDRLELRLDFTQTAPGESYTIRLPEIFVRLDQAVIEAGNAAILPYVDITLAYDPATGTQRVVIAFKEAVMAASFSFVGTLNFSGEFTEKAVTVDSVGTILLQHQNTTTGPGINFGTRPSPPGLAPEDFLLKTASASHITDRQLMEDSAIGNSFYYTLRLNYALFGNGLIASKGMTYTGTLRDELPTGMRLFIPNAPNINAADLDDYRQAYRSFDIIAYSSAIQKDGNGYYMDLPSSYLAAVNRVEGSQGRAGAYVPGDLVLRLNLSQSIAERLDNGEGTLVTYSSLYVGYRLEGDGKIHFYAINSYTGAGDGQGAPYEQIRAVPWSDTANTRCVPLYTTADGSVGSVQSRTPFTTQTVQSNNTGNLLSSFTREHLGESVLPDGTVINQWRYLYHGREEFTLSAAREPGGRDSFEVKMNVLDENSFFHGKAFAIRPHIYFDRAQWRIPSDGLLTFRNTAAYGAISKEAAADYSYHFGSAGTVVAGAKKTVDGAKKSNMNPDADRELSYAVEFRKSGSLDIPAGNFNVFDTLDGNLDFVPGSIRIYRRPDSASAWIDVSGDAGPAFTQSKGPEGGPDDLNLKAAYETAGGISRIALSNTGTMAVSAATEIKVEFKAALKPEVKYGTKITNYFGESVETWIDHKIAVHKVDEDGNGIAAPAVFALRYTTDTDYETGALHDIPFPATGSGGRAQALYQLDAELFYLKLTEEAPPAHHFGIGEPIWIKASRDSVTSEMRYTLAKAPAGVQLAADPDGLVTITVPNRAVPAEEPPAEPPETEPSETEPPVTEPSPKEPSPTEPSETKPTTTEPFVTEPSTAEPSKARPAKAVPLLTVPPLPRRPISWPNASAGSNAMPVTRAGEAETTKSIAERSMPERSAPEKNTFRERVPDTGDNSAIFLLPFLLLLFSAGGAAAAIVNKTQKEQCAYEKK
ncbi:MAG: hypothetical protein FWH26_04810 [Oscillospiraceae bacterium]|nr:hypothetical protein [Oscillospiraceae bacterium]